jgi:muramoyltetrapeptide carboxypeptidase LdcA involved in peptidoglycan recycling
MAGFAYAPCFQESMEEYKGVFSAHAPYMLSPFSTWGERYRAWGDENSPIEMESYFRDDIGHRWLNKGRAVSGMPWGGCIEILSMMNDTFAWPGPDFWNERILCIETSEDKPSPDQVAFVLRNFGIQGILSKIRGLLVARPKSYSAEEKEELNDAIVRVALQEFGCHDLNIVSNIDFGHTDPRHIIAFGIPMWIDPVAERLEYEEPLFS